MSYTKRYRETVSKSVSKTVSYSYPASQNGGSGSVTAYMDVQIPIDINIDVDTVAFDQSVNSCNTNIDILTGAVVATEAAEIVSRNQNSKRIADTIIGGFFGYIRSEISQQVAELAQNIDAQLLHLKELAKSCLDKKKQMESDYNRITSRYLKVFKDLDTELSNRIYELDKASFTFIKETDSQKQRRTENDLVNTVTIFGTDNSNLNSQIGASIAKKRALDTINQAKMFLWDQKRTDMTIHKSMIEHGESGPLFAFVCYTETINMDHQFDKKVVYADFISSLNGGAKDGELVEMFSSESVEWNTMSADEKDKIMMYFNTEVNEKIAENDEHSMRVRKMIQKLADFNSINTIRFN